MISAILPYCCTQLGPIGLACLAATSKQMRTACTTIMQLDARRLLLGALDAAGAAGAAVGPAASIGSAPAASSAAYKSLQSVAWLLEAVPSVITAEDIAERLVHTPAVPLACAVQLVAAGVRVSCKQVLAAADSMVPGVEVWVQAQEHLGVQTDIPAAAIAICCGSNWVSCHLQRQATLVAVLRYTRGVHPDEGQAHDLLAAASLISGVNLMCSCLALGPSHQPLPQLKLKRFVECSRLCDTKPVSGQNVTVQCNRQ
jgi:hypothetical protein